MATQRYKVDLLREEIARQTEEFLSKGGKIREIPPVKINAIPVGDLRYLDDLITRVQKRAGGWSPFAA